MTVEVKTASIENFKKLCEVAGLTEEQQKYCKSITVSCDENSGLFVDVKYWKFEEEK